MNFSGHPKTIWVLAAGGGISAVGASMVVPLLTLFFTERHGVSLGAATALLAVFFIAGSLGNLIGGSAADAAGRRPVMLASMGGAAVASIVVGFSNQLGVLTGALAVFGFTTASFQPAGRAVVADIVPARRRAETFALLRVAFNAGFAVGPALAGLFLALGRDAAGLLDPNAYRPLFVADAATSALFGLLVLLTVPETIPRSTSPAASPDGAVGALSGRRSYIEVLAHRRFLAFNGLWILVVVLYIQLFSTVGPYLAAEATIGVERFAALLSINAAMVVLGQIWVTRGATRLGVRRTLAAGVLLHGAGLLLLVVATTIGLVGLAIVVFTVGEMLLAPTGESVAAGFSTEENRGRYMGVFTFASTIGFALGPIAGGVAIDRGWGDLLWIGSFVLSTIAAYAFLRLFREAGIPGGRGQPIGPSSVQQAATAGR